MNLTVFAGILLAVTMATARRASLGEKTMQAAGKADEPEEAMREPASLVEKIMRAADEADEPAGAKRANGEPSSIVWVKERITNSRGEPGVGDIGPFRSFANNQEDETSLAFCGPNFLINGVWAECPSSTPCCNVTIGSCKRRGYCNVTKIRTCGPGEIDYGKPLGYWDEKNNRCGPNNLVYGAPAECNPYSDTPCCSLHVGYCGSCTEHYDIDYRQPGEEECYTGKGYHYRGPVNVSASGNACENWDFKADPTSLFVRPDRYPGAGLVGNYCRNPTYNTKNETLMFDAPWCYVWKSWNIFVKELCDIPKCRDCYEQNGKSYRGLKRVTESGLNCQFWYKHEPHDHPDITPAKHPNAGLVANYCRNPNGRERPWCFTTDPGKTWEYCDIPQCPDVQLHWRRDGRCGPKWGLLYGQAGACNPQSTKPCCNNDMGICGRYNQHCKCIGCDDYRKARESPGDGTCKKGTALDPQETQSTSTCFYHQDCCPLTKCNNYGRAGVCIPTYGG